MSNSNQAFMDYPNSYYSPSINIPQFHYSSLPISTYATYSPMEQYSTLPSDFSYYHVPDEHVDDMALILDSEDMFDHPQTQIGPVINPGLSEKNISKKLKTSRYQVACKAEEEEEEEEEEEGEEVCEVCQVEYKVNEKIGTLHCGHKYHSTCIKQWLLLISVCPVCRATVLDV